MHVQMLIFTLKWGFPFLFDTEKVHLYKLRVCKFNSKSVSLMSVKVYWYSFFSVVPQHYSIIYKSPFIFSRAAISQLKCSIPNVKAMSDFTSKF